MAFAEDMSNAPAGHPNDAIRAHIRSGAHTTHTSGLADGFLQANLAILPAKHALDFYAFCQRNPKPCPLVGVSDPGDPMMRTLGADIDIRTDIPSYNIYRHGELTESTTEIRDLWQEDSVAFALGCSFTFEHALQRAGITLRHMQSGQNVPMFATNIELTPAGPFRGTMVVSMRAIPNERIDEAIAISSRFPQAHGAPVHVGDPTSIGIEELGAPQWGTAQEVYAGETPMFWACGVTPQNVVLNARPDICITHTPGCMLITDVPEDAETTILKF